MLAKGTCFSGLICTCVLYVVTTTFALAQEGLPFRELTLNTTGDFPLNSLDQTGFQDRVTREALRRLGFELKTVQVPAERGLINANTGVVDGEMSRINGLEKLYPNLRRVPQSIMDWEFCAFSRENISLQHGWSDLAGHSVAYINGWKILENNVPETSQVTRVRNPEQLFGLLQKKRVDMILFERWAGLYLLRKYQLNDARILQPPLAVRHMYIYLNKKHEGLIQLLSQVLTDMRNDGSYAALVRDILEPFNREIIK